MYRYARSRVATRDVAEDLVQDAFLAALQSRDRFENRATTRTWLLSILRRKIVDHYRRAAASRVAVEMEPTHNPDPIKDRFFTENGLWKADLASWNAPEQALDKREFWQAFDACVGRLPRSLASAFILRELESIPTRELRDILGVSESNLRVRLHRARLLLRSCLEQHWLDEPSSKTSKRTS